MGLRHAKIVCTLGPATDDVKAIGALIDAGMDVARLNFSHGTHEEHARRLATVRARSARARQADRGPAGPAGPEDPHRPRPARHDRRRAETVTLVEGSRRRRRRRSPSNTRGWPRICTPVIWCAWTTGGSRCAWTRSRAAGSSARCCRAARCAIAWASTLPSKRVRLPALTDQDRRDLAHGLAIGVDYVALSFVKRADDVAGAARGVQARRPADADRRQDRDARGGRATSGRWSAAADAVMVARGDLGVELSPEHVPVVQKEIIGTCRLQQTPGDRRDRDAAVDGRFDAADPRRGERRRVGGVRRRRRADAVGRDGDRQAPARARAR